MSVKAFVIFIPHTWLNVIKSYKINTISIQQTACMDKARKMQSGRAQTIRTQMVSVWWDGRALRPAWLQ